MRVYLLAAAAAFFATTGVYAAPISLILDYDLTGPVSNSPPTVFNSAAITPGIYSGVFPNPTLTASSSTLNASVTQSGFGLGIRSTPPGFLNQELAGGLSRLRVDNVGNFTNLPESLTLAVSGIHVGFIDTRLTAINFQGVLDPDGGNDVTIFRNGVSQGDFNFAGLFGGVLTLPTPIGVNEGDILTFQPVSGSQLNGFALAGIQLQAEVVPEPSSFAIFGGTLLGLLGYRRRNLAPPLIA